MPRHTFKQHQQQLQDEVLILGSQVEELLADAVKAFKQRDLPMAARLIADGRMINKKCAAIEANTLALFVTQQPMAGDLRFLAGVLEIALELERIGDHGKEISLINLKVGELSLLQPFDYIPQMAKEAGGMLHQALEAFARQDLKLAYTIPSHDDKVDRLYEHVSKALMGIIKTNRQAIVQAVYLSQVAHHLERVADRATNLCEWVAFVVTGEIQELSKTHENTNLH